jgi:hypothetical protein
LAKLKPKTRIDLLKANGSSTVMAGKIDRPNPVQAVVKVQFISMDSAFGRIQKLFWKDGLMRVAMVTADMAAGCWER